MFKASTLRLVSRSLQRTGPSISSPVSRNPAFIPTRLLSSTPANKKSNDPHHTASTAAGHGESAGSHEGSASRTDNQISFEYPAEEEFPREPAAQGREDEAAEQAKILVEQFKHDNLGAEEYDRSKFERGKKQGVFRTPKVTAHFADVSSPDSVNSAIAEILGQHGKIDHLVTSAGFTENYDAIAYPYERMKKLWGVNVDGTYLFATGVAKHLMERNSPGSIVMIGSMSGSIVNVPQPQAPYNAAKAAVRHLAASMAVEWAHANIRVNCISPGYMLTALTRKILDEKPDLKKQWTSLIPTGKMGRPEDLMGAVTFLLSDASGYVTGADLRVDGGYTVT